MEADKAANSNWSASSEGLGPLPEPAGELWELRTPRGKPPFRYYTLEQVRDMLAAERERCARLEAAPTANRKPLTHMQIVQLWGHRSDGPTTAEIVSFARAIERAQERNKHD
jgi:hypothetical protein